MNTKISDKKFFTQICLIMDEFKDKTRKEKQNYCNRCFMSNDKKCLENLL